jgi:hypothetical protein
MLSLKVQGKIWNTKQHVLYFVYHLLYLFSKDPVLLLSGVFV